MLSRLFSLSLLLCSCILFFICLSSFSSFDQSVFVYAEEFVGDYDDEHEFFVPSQVKEVDPSKLYLVKGKVKLPVRPSKPLQAKVSVDGGEFVSIVRIDGSFQVHVPAGIHTLEVLSVDYIFDPVKLDVSAEEDGKVRGTNLLDNNFSKVPYPLVIQAQIQPQYYQKREPMSLKPLLSNPMVLIMGGMFIFMLFMQKMMANMDPEELAEMKKMQQQYSVQGMLSKAQKGK